MACLKINFSRLTSVSSNTLALFTQRNARKTSVKPIDLGASSQSALVALAMMMMPVVNLSPRCTMPAHVKPPSSKDDKRAQSPIVGEIGRCSRISIA